MAQGTWGTLSLVIKFLTIYRARRVQARSKGIETYLGLSDEVEELWAQVCFHMDLLA